MAHRTEGGGGSDEGGSEAASAARTAPPFHPESLVPRAAPTSATSTSSEQTLWRSAAAKRAEKRWAEQSERSLQSDNAFRKYQANVERTLARFESVSEWADLISFLGKLLKTLQTAPHFHVIPHKLIVAKRLSQCLNPALPSGLHARAIEVYAYIFEVIGLDGLRRDLPVWSPGLLPFFQHASMSVRPALLGVFEKYYVPLSVDLRPLTRALLLALLPGLEEEAGEFFEPVVRLLDHCSSSVGTPFFLQNLWMVLVSSSADRLSALHYLARRMPKVHEGDGSVALLGQDPSLMVRGFVHALGDNTLLVRRHALDFLERHLALDGFVFNRVITDTDRVLLMDAAIGCVLRRDISLNRRLYTWLLGSGDSEDAQHAYFEAHALPHVRAALCRALATPDPAAPQRPLRILIALLDKGVVGQPLLRAMVLHAFAPVAEPATPSAEPRAPTELLPTLQMLYSAVDAFVLYQALYDALRGAKGAQMPPDDAAAVLRGLLRSFNHHEEVLLVHFPALYLALVGMAAEAPSHDAEQLMSLAAIVQQALPAQAFVETHNEEGPASADLGHAAVLLYAQGNAISSPLQNRAVCDALLAVLMRIAVQSAEQATESTPPHGHVAVASPFVSAADHAQRALLGVIEDLDTARGDAYAPLSAVPEPEEQGEREWPDAAAAPPAAPGAFRLDAWNDAVSSCLAAAASFFAFAQRLRVVLLASRSAAITGTFAFDDRAYYTPVLDKLLSYLQPDAFVYHAEAVDLFWQVRDQGRFDFATSMLCERIASSDAAERDASSSALGALWRLSTAERQADLAAPVFMMLDTLRSHDVRERERGAAWLRTHVASYAPLLVLVARHALGIHAATRDAPPNTAPLPLRVYTAPFEQDLLNYYLETLLALMRASGEAGHMAVEEPLASTGSSSELTPAVSLPPGEIRDVLKDYALVLVRSEPSETYRGAMQAGNAATRSLSLALLHELLGSSPPAAWCSDVQRSLLALLQLAVEREDGDLQSGTLPLLLAVLQRTVRAGMDGTQGSAPIGSSVLQAELDDDTCVQLGDLIRRGLPASATPAAFYAWTSFARGVLPLARQSAQMFVQPVCIFLSDLVAQGAAALAIRISGEGARTLHEVLAPALAGSAPRSLPAHEAELADAAALLEHFVAQGMASTAALDPPPSAESDAASSTGILGNLSSVFVGDASTASAPAGAAASVPLLARCVGHAVHALHYAWAMGRCHPAGVSSVVAQTAPPADGQGSAEEAAVLPVLERTCAAALDRLYRTHASGVVDALVERWSQCTLRHANGLRRTVLDGAFFDALLRLASSEQIVVTFLCDSIASRTAPASSERARKTPWRSARSGDVALLRFLDAYLGAMESRTAAHVWPVLVLLIKGIISSNAGSRRLVFYTLCLVVTAGHQMCTVGDVLDEWRTRRDLQDTFARLCELVISLYARRLDPQSAARRGVRDGDAESTTDSREKDDTGAGDPDAAPGPAVVLEYLTNEALPALVRFGLDTDKTQGICQSLAQYVLVPGFRARSSGVAVDPAVLDLLERMCTVPGTMRVWRSVVQDAFNDPRFFALSPHTGKRWTGILAALLAESDRLVEVIARISSTSVSNLFSSREADILARSTSIRRLSFAIFSAPKDAFLAQLPMIQEKLVDVVRANPPELVQAEVRILWCLGASADLYRFTFACAYCCAGTLHSTLLAFGPLFLPSSYVVIFVQLFCSPVLDALAWSGEGRAPRGQVRRAAPLIQRRQAGRLSADAANTRVPNVRW